jgi:5-(hydroxymethyl)furfural/furfural oxidase
VELVTGEHIDAAHVVSCAGAIHSPALLQRSGVAHDAIGRGLHDHASIPAVLMLRADAQQADDNALAVGSLMRWSSSIGHNDLQLLPINHLGVGPEGHALGMLMVGVMDVVSRGRVSIVSDDPLVEPSIDFDMLSDPDDVVRANDGLITLLEVLDTDAIRSVADVALLGASGTPPDVVRALTDRADWMRANLGDYVHAAGTCRMGLPDDPASVVDLDGHVIGVSGLSVVDASIIPTIPRANTHQPVTVIAEHIARRWLSAR